MENKRLLLIDTFYFLHRSFHAYPKDLMSPHGEFTNIVFGFSQSILDIISEIAPTHIACGWESEELPSFRKTLYADYQINRVQMEPDLERVFSEQIPRIIKIIEAFNIPRITSNGFEGDDVLGTVATLASKDANVIVATADQDLLQLINDRISVYRPGRPPFVKKQIFNEAIFIEKYGFHPIQMIDYKALRGDPSDNIPGVKGIGDKTAKELLQKYVSVEDIYEHVDEIKSESIKSKLIADREKAFMSKQLATIITNIPIEFDLNACEVHDFDINEVRALFEDQGFTSLNKKLDKLESLMKVKQKLEEKKKPKDQMALF